MDIKNFQTHRPTDPSDPGFTIPGARLRWVSGRVRERSETASLWVPLRKSAIPEALRRHLENCYPNCFGEGDTIRRGGGELILAYATQDAARKRRTELDQLTREQTARARILSGQERVGPKDYAKVEINEETAGSIPSQFLGKKNSE